MMNFNFEEMAEMIGVLFFAVVMGALWYAFYVKPADAMKYQVLECWQAKNNNQVHKFSS